MNVSPKSPNPSTRQTGRKSSVKSNRMRRNNSHRTAIHRKLLPLPTRWLQKQGLLIDPVLDFGCGTCWAINPAAWWNYDPHWYPLHVEVFNGKVKTVICNYVMCVVNPRDRKKILRQIQDTLSPNGIAYISVNKRRPKNGWGRSSTGTYQGRGMNLCLPEVYSNGSFKILKLTKETSI